MPSDVLDFVIASNHTGIMKALGIPSGRGDGSSSNTAASNRAAGRWSIDHSVVGVKPFYRPLTDPCFAARTTMPRHTQQGEGGCEGLASASEDSALRRADALVNHPTAYAPQDGPLHAAAEWCQPAVVRALLGVGLVPCCGGGDDDGHSADCCYLIRGSAGDGTNEKREEEEAFVKQGDGDGPASHHHRHRNVLLPLVDVDARNSEGRTALHKLITDSGDALASGYFEPQNTNFDPLTVARILIEMGADVDAVVGCAGRFGYDSSGGTDGSGSDGDADDDDDRVDDTDGRATSPVYTLYSLEETPLRLLCESYVYTPGLAQLLLDNGADLECCAVPRRRMRRAQRGSYRLDETVWDLAKVYGHVDIMDSLQQEGCLN